MGINWKNHIIEVLKEKYDELEYDGWSIMHIEYFTDMGFDEEFIKPLVYRHPSMGGKHDLFDNDGKYVDYIEGIHYLNFLEKITNILNPEFYPKKMGRGFRAGECLKEIKRVLNEPVTLSEG